MIPLLFFSGLVVEFSILFNRTFQHNNREINKYQLFTNEESFNKNKNIINQKYSFEQTLEFYLIPNYHIRENKKDGIEDIEKHPISNLTIKDIKRSEPSTIEDNKEISLLKSFNYYLKKDQINDKSLDIDDLKITKYLNEIIELRNPLCSKINDLH
ncbi:22467_t:CDS:2 [Dentiscutata erythropus]|uniref:22467_t:CDS:1 n=1 Tax=Dentiscutata erythropus TaxID=1348616 RepID=A0A9N8ZBE3_9GLOM|nr:22467_t:CDS:2 [Dentiscutata erythropus]